MEVKDEKKSNNNVRNFFFILVCVFSAGRFFLEFGTFAIVNRIDQRLQGKQPVTYDSIVSHKTKQ